jgi:hypothetical protein
MADNKSNKNSSASQESDKEREVRRFIEHAYDACKKRDELVATNGDATKHYTSVQSAEDEELLTKPWRCVWCGKETTTFMALTADRRSGQLCSKNQTTQRHESLRYSVIDLVPLISLSGVSREITNRRIMVYNTLEDLLRSPIIYGYGVDSTVPVVCPIASAYCETLFNFGWRDDLHWVAASRIPSQVPPTAEQYFHVEKFKAKRKQRTGIVNKEAPSFYPVMQSLCDLRQSLTVNFIPFVVLSRLDGGIKFTLA